MSRIIYLVCGTLEAGRRDAELRGCERIGANRFAMPNKDDLRVIHRFNEMVPMAGKTPLIRGSDYDDMPSFKDELGATVWLDNHEEFERFVREGWGEWVD